MRLPFFDYHAPYAAEEVVKILKEEGPDAHIVAGGTDLYPNMKRRQHPVKTVVSLRHVDELKSHAWNGGLEVGANTTLRELERDTRLKETLPALWTAVESISTPLLRNMGTLGGNVMLDTRCYYINQNYEWRRTINHCLKCGGDTCWTAPGSKKCWAVNSSDTVPVLMAMGATLRLLGPDGAREVACADMYDVEDGREWLRRKPGELLTAIRVPDQGDACSVYLKLRRRGTFDFPVLGVAARIERDGDTVKSADLILNAVGPAPIRCTAAEQALVGSKLDDETIAEAVAQSSKAAKPLDNTDYMPSWRKRMVKVYVKRALEALRP
ncbi:MAG: FAD binding domain-containing protein [Planctomycetota bacterium]